MSSKEVLSTKNKSRKATTIPTPQNGNAWVGIIAALILIAGGVVLVWLLYKRGQTVPEDESKPTPTSPIVTEPIVVTPPPPVVPPTKPKPKDPKEPKEEPKDPNLLTDPALRWPWVGQSFMLNTFYTERDGVQYQLRTSWLSGAAGPHSFIKLVLSPVLTYIDWNDIVAGRDGDKYLYLSGGPKEGLLDLINYETVNGRVLWKSGSKLVNDDGKSFEFSLGRRETEEEGMTPMLLLRYMSFTATDKGPTNPILDVQSIEFEANVQTNVARRQ